MEQISEFFFILRRQNYAKFCIFFLIFREIPVNSWEAYFALKIVKTH